MIASKQRERERKGWEWGEDYFDKDTLFHNLPFRKIAMYPPELGAVLVIDALK